MGSTPLEEYLKARTITRLFKFDPKIGVYLAQKDGRPKPGKKYKPVHKRVVPVATTLPEDFRVVRRFPSDPLDGMRELPTNPPDFAPKGRVTQDRWDSLKVGADGFLTEEEVKLVGWVMTEHESAFAFSVEERGAFNDEYFEPVIIPTVEHIPWAERNMPIPPGIFDEVCAIMKDKLATGVYEPSNSSYRSRWFCVVKKDGKSLRIVHDLQKLNSVTIKDAAVPPMVEQIAESFAGRSAYAMFDLYVAFDQRKLAPESRDLTAFQSPLGALRLTTLPMGWTNSVQILHGDVSFVLREEIPHSAVCFIDDIGCPGPRTRYEDADGKPACLPENPRIRRFVFETCATAHRILQRIQYAGATVSGLKSHICVPEVVILGHKCTYEGRVPDETRVDKIRNWPPCKSVTEVRGFLGTAGVVRIFIKDFAIHARPLVNLTKKDADFEWGEREQAAMDALKRLICTSPALRPIDYASAREVVLAVDSSVIGVGFVIYQVGEDGRRRYPSRFGSIPWSDVERRYSQAKLELYGLFRALKATRLYLIGVSNLTVEVDAKYIKGMLNNPDIQPNAAVNRWIAGIHLFQFTLRHVPAEKHKGPDGLSRRESSPEDAAEESSDEVEAWLDTAMGFIFEVENRRPPPTLEAITDPGGKTGKELPGTAVFLAAESSEIPDALPQSAKGKRRDARLVEIQKFLEEGTRPATVDENGFRQFVKGASSYFVRDGRLWRRDRHGRHLVVVPSNRRLGLLRQAHDELGHKGVYTVRTRLLERFWWPGLLTDVKWYIRTCHQCQIRQTRRIHIPPVVPKPHRLFGKVYVDTMSLPPARWGTGRLRYSLFVHARCSLTSWCEGRMLVREDAESLARFLFEEVLCRWGTVSEIVTDNGSSFLLAGRVLAERYGCAHITISPYNSQANGVVERRHFDFRESLIKACGGEEERWPEMVHATMWAERTTILRSTGLSPYFMVHGVEPIFPFDVVEATYLVDPPDIPAEETDLIAFRAKQLSKREMDLAELSEKVYKARKESAARFTKRFAGNIVDHDLQPGQLALVRNTRVEKELNRKTKPRYLGPMVVVRRKPGGTYVLSEISGAVSRVPYAAFRVVPYAARSTTRVPVTTLTGLSEEELDRIERAIPDVEPLPEDAEEGPLGDDE